MGLRFSEQLDDPAARIALAGKIAQFPLPRAESSNMRPDNSWVPSQPGAAWKLVSTENPCTLCQTLGLKNKEIPAP